MDTKGIGWAAAVERVRQANICPRGDEVRQLVEWAAAGLLKGTSKVAVVNGKPRTDFPIPQQAWEAVKSRSGSVDPSSGKLVATFQGDSFTSSGHFAAVTYFELSATLIEFSDGTLLAELPGRHRLKQAKPHPSSYVGADEPLIEKMREMIERESCTVNAAALAFVDEAEGGGNTESKVRRLRDRYNAVRG